MNLWTIAMAAAVAILACQAARAADSAPALSNAAVEKTSQGDLTIAPINHSAIRFEFKGKQYYVDPAGEANWATMPKADAIFITHEHGDHLSLAVIEIGRASCREKCDLACRSRWSPYH
jgi:hypothetical protein